MATGAILAMVACCCHIFPVENYYGVCCNKVVPQWFDHTMWMST